MKSLMAACGIYLVACGAAISNASEPGLPVVTNCQAIAHGEIAQILGHLASVGVDLNAHVALHYGETDGATNAAMWSNNVSLGLCSPGILSVALSDLNLGGEYFFRFSASNSVGTAWAHASSAFRVPTERGHSEAETDAMVMHARQDVESTMLHRMLDRNAERYEVLSFLESSSPIYGAITNWASLTTEHNAMFITNALPFDVRDTYVTDITSATNAFRSVLHLWWKNDAQAMYDISDASGARILEAWNVATNKMLYADLLTRITVLMTMEKVAYDGVRYVAVLGRMQAAENPRSNVIVFPWLGFREAENGYLFTHDLSGSMIGIKWKYAGLAGAIDFLSYSNAHDVATGSYLPPYFYTIDE